MPPGESTKHPLWETPTLLLQDRNYLTFSKWPAWVLFLMVIFLHFYLLSICVYMYACICVKARAYMSGNNLQELVLSFFHAGSQGLNSDHQAWQQISLHAEPYQPPCVLTLIQAFSMESRA